MSGKKRADTFKATGHHRLDAIRKRMIPLADLKYGQSPWDSLDREDMVFLLHSYHAAAAAAASAIMTIPGHLRSMSMDESASSLRAARDYLFSDFGGVRSMNISYGSEAVEGHPHGYTETEIVWRYMMRPVGGCLAFDVPDYIWWVCEGCDTCIGLKQGQTPDSRTDSKMGGCKVGCGWRLHTWDDWRGFKDAPAEGEKA